jgi:methionyl aminopeptidase
VISFKTPEEIDKMREAGRLVAGAHAVVGEAARPGISTEELDILVRDFVTERGGQLLFYRYKGFPANSCISINDEVVHGIPRKRRKLKDGDIVSVDIGVKLCGYCGDSAWTYAVGEISDDAAALMAVGEESLGRGIASCGVGARVSHIGEAIQSYVEAQGYHVVKKYVGHGIGTQLHEEPQVPNYVDGTFFGKNDPVMREGLVLAIEPMVNLGTEEVETLNDGWTVVTKDRSLSVHFEHTVAVTADGPVILTQL